MTNRFTKTSFFVQGGIMRPPSDGGLKTTTTSMHLLIIVCTSKSGLIVQNHNIIQIISVESLLYFR